MMASFRPKVLNPNGHDALLDVDDNLTLDNAPQVDTDATNKLYVDTEIDAAEASLTTDYDAKIQAEADARIAADDALLDAINAEAATRADEDAALQEQINLITGDAPGSENPYVKRSGDDMSGSLTLGTDKIILNATDGSINSGDVDGNEVTARDLRVLNDVLGSTNYPFIINTDIGNCLDVDRNGNMNITGAFEALSIDGGTY